MHSFKSKIAISQFFNLASILLVLAVIVVGEVVLIGENAAFLQSQGKSPFTAVALAACVALLILAIPGFLIQDDRLWFQVIKWFFVASLIAMQVYFAAQTAIAPQLEKMATNSEIALIQDYKAQLKQYDNQIALYGKHIDAFPESYRTKRAELSAFQVKLIEDRRQVLSALQDITQMTRSKPENLTGMFQHLTLATTIFYRLALEIGVVILACSLRDRFAIAQPITPEKPLVQNATDPSQNPDPPEDTKAPVSAKEFVLSIYPQAFCKSKNGRQGPFVVYSNRLAETEIAKANGTATAWQKAAQKLKKDAEYI